MDIRLILIISNIVTLIVFAAVVSIERNKIKETRDALEHSTEQVEMLLGAVERAKVEIKKANERIDAALAIHTEGLENAHKQHEQRLEQIEAIQREGSESAKDWLCESVPLDVCELLNTNAKALQPDQDRNAGNP